MLLLGCYLKRGKHELEGIHLNNAVALAPAHRLAKVVLPVVVEPEPGRIVAVERELVCDVACLSHRRLRLKRCHAYTVEIVGLQNEGTGTVCAECRCHDILAVWGKVEPCQCVFLWNKYCLAITAYLLVLCL